MKIILFIILIILYWDISTRKYKDKYNSILLFGGKGVGKTSTLQMLAIKEGKNFSNVFSNADLFMCTQIEGKDIGKMNFPEDSLLLIDELGILFPSRDFKNFGLDRIEWFKKQRHNKVKIIACSQSYDDADKQIRDLYDELWLLKKHFRILTIGKQIIIEEDIYNSSINTDNGDIRVGGTIVKNYKYGLRRIYTYLPKYIKLFDSFELGERDIIKYEIKYPDFYNSLLLQRFGYFQEKILSTAYNIIAVVRYYYFKEGKCQNLKNKLNQLLLLPKEWISWKIYLKILKPTK